MTSLPDIVSTLRQSEWTPSFLPNSWISSALDPSLAIRSFHSCQLRSGPNSIQISLVRLHSTNQRNGRSGKSAWENRFCKRDFKAVLIAPIKINVVMHVPPHDWISWDQHIVMGYYVGSGHEHYWCYRIWISATKAFRVSECLEWFPADILSVSQD